MLKASSGPSAVWTLPLLAVWIAMASKTAIGSVTSNASRDAGVSASSFELRNAPFSKNFDRRCRYLAPSRSHVMDSLKSDIEAGRSLLLLVAQKGVGKTELLSRLANNLSDSVRSILLTHVSSRSLAHR